MASTRQRQRVPAAKATTPRRQSKKARGGSKKARGGSPGSGRSRAAISDAARKAWETRRMNGWQHPAKVRSLTPSEISAASGVPVAKVQRILELGAKRIP